MHTTVKRVLGVGACLAAVGLTASAQGADKAPAPDKQQPAHSEQGEKILTAKTFRTSQLVGMNVRNLDGEYLGTIDDLVIDLRNGQVQYAALSVGGILGLGEKLFAVPFDELKFDHGQDEMFFVLDMAPEKLAAAPGFDKNDWPDFADPDWTAKIHKHYRQTAATRQETEQRTSTVEENK